MTNTCCVAFLVLSLSLFVMHVESNEESRRKKPTRYKRRESCFANGRRYNVGDTFMNDCNSCSCIEGGIPVCTRILCLPLTTELPPRTTTRRPRSGCVANGREYSVGERFKIDCNRCSCRRRGRISCTKRFCGPTTTEPTTTTRKVGCLVGGVHYEVGENFNIDCNGCTCTESGFPICTLIDCSASGLASTTTTGNPTGCVENGVRYDVGEIYMNDCNSCTCTSTGVSACTLRACLPSGK